MGRKILETLAIFLLIIFPLSGGAIIGNYTPYNNGNNVASFVMVYLLSVLVIVAVFIYITHRFKQSFIQPVLPGVILFLLGCVMFGIAGLKEAPDLSIKMLEHPEREHLRYIILFIGALLLAWYFFTVYAKNFLQHEATFKRIMLAMAIIVIIEMIWEFYHHYSYPEGLKKWMDKGNRVEDFGKNYDDWKVGTPAAIGRLILYSLILWMSVRLYKIKKTRLWNPILTAFFCVLGILSSIVMFLYFCFDIEAPKELGFLIILFIPGIPFLILYWIGVALLTRRPVPN